ncbi:TPR repeat protein [Trichormus variabilis ATCC 29413]|uniref:TPR repeat protein n=3 Tax=Anabaena variabilis TaxID=264691 RepID=Q3MD69_TRIV2|nr:MULTISPECIES: tetratricopeptide repeat protein [Nostocaceae]MBC1215793.1 tetratricopeptide repeat protein [Trichormus variabilis ARAD]MBC1302331.1 tetratricopeptide repeat protein [Trichormus variabilis N2B]MBC1326893.1 tetratricopeptide repeat protein [Trichormus variabilis 9RC]MBD2380733.1 tetratricopeptide repeat protein [Trichormus variabilis FACHB-319]ABA21067.1 TPR repeat protein [Trichormus variabilis ATCC 29413]
MALTHPTKMSTVLREIAYCEHQIGEVDRASNYYEQALNLCPAEDERELGAIYDYLGMLKDDKGEVDQAIALYNQSLEIKERIGNVQGKAATLHQLGILHADKGEVAQAIALYHQSLEITEHIGNVQGKAITLWCLGHLAEQQGEYAKAISYLQPALEILQRLQSPHAEDVRVSLERVMGNS